MPIREEEQQYRQHEHRQRLQEKLPDSRAVTTLEPPTEATTTESHSIPNPSATPIVTNTQPTGFCATRMTNKPPISAHPTTGTAHTKINGTGPSSTLATPPAPTSDTTIITHTQMTSHDRKRSCTNTVFLTNVPKPLRSRRPRPPFRGRGRQDDHAAVQPQPELSPQSRQV
jgi:hypothetical protein